MIRFVFVLLVVVLTGCGPIFIGSTAHSFTPALTVKVAASPPLPVTIVFDAPNIGATMVDSETFSFHITGTSAAISAVANVELRISGQAIDEVPVHYHGADLDAGPAVFNGTLTTSAKSLIYDGDYTAQWLVKDRSGTVITQSERRSIIVRRLTPTNAPGVTWNYYLDPITPADGSVVSGITTLSFTASWAPISLSTWGNILYEYFVDGYQVVQSPRYYGPEGTPRVWQLDTTAYPNGIHQVYMQGILEGPPPAILFYTIRRELDFENGHLPRAIVPEYAEVDLHPGQSFPLKLRRYWTDGASDVIDPSQITVTNTDTVNSPIVLASGSLPGIGSSSSYWGTLLALPGKSGSTSLVFSSPGLGSTTVQIYIQDDLRVSHISRSGQTRKGYDPSSSVFIRSMFASGSNTVNSHTSLATEYKAAGLNTIEQGFYSNPADSHVVAPGAETQAMWSAWVGTTPWTKSFDGPIDPWYDWAQQNGFLLILTGDDTLRTSAEQIDTANNPWAMNAIQYALLKATNAGNAVAIEMVDETDLFLGSKPTATALSVLATINQVPGHPSVGWPLLGNTAPASVQGWQGDPTVSDHITYYWTYLDATQAFPFGPSIGEVATYMLYSSYYARRPYIQRTSDEPFLFMTNDGMYGPLNWWTGHNLYLAEQEAAEIMLAATVGAAGVRVYKMDTDDNKKARANALAQAGTNQWPTCPGVFSDPWTIATDHWASISAAFHFVSSLEPLLFGERINAVALTGRFVVGARLSGSTRLYMAVNMSESSSQQAVNLTPYLPSTVQSITRRRLKGDGTTVSETIATNTIIDTVTFDSAETIAWIIQ